MSNGGTPETASEVVERRLSELKVRLDERIHYRSEKVFPKVIGWGANSEISRRAKLIRKVEPTLRRVLLDGEEVLYIAKGVQYSLLERYLMGIWSALLNQTVFVLTNVRLLMMRSDGSGTPREMFWMIYYSEIAKFHAGWTGVLGLKLVDGRKLSFTGFSSLDRRAMPVIFREAMADYLRLNFTPSTSQSRENLCNSCFKIVPKDHAVCQQCGTEFWKPHELALRSLILPSWGDICMKHYLFAVFELLFYLGSWGKVAFFFEQGETHAALAMMGFIFLIEHPVDAMITYALACKGLHHRRDPDPHWQVAMPEQAVVLETSAES